MIRVAALLALLAAPSAALELKIFHTNDVHGWVMARPATLSYAVQPSDAGRMIGGVPALSNYLKQEKGPRLVLDGGDWFQGTPEGNGTKGEIVVDAFNAIPYDAVVLGNHDFDYGTVNLQRLVMKLKMPSLCANCYDAKTGKRIDWAKPWVIKNVSGVKVGIFGLITFNMKNLSFPENIDGLEFRSPVKEAAVAVEELKKQGATVILGLSHIGFQEAAMEAFESDNAVAAAVPGIDVMVGGHTHTFMEHPVREPKNGTLIVQGGAALSRVGRVVLDIDDKTGKVKSSTGSLVRLWVDQYGEDEAVKKVVTAYDEQIRREYDVPLAESSIDLTRNRNGESTAGQWMADCAREWGGAEVAIQNGGGVRADLPKGPVTYRTIFNLMPFDNAMVKLTMSGGLITDLLDIGVDRTKGMIQASGATFVYDRDKARGTRVSNVALAGKPADAAKAYTVVSTDFLVKGGDGYVPFAKAEKTEFSKVLLRDVLAECARKQKVIKLPEGGRMKLADGAKP